VSISLYSQVIQINFKETCGNPSSSIVASTYLGWSNVINPTFTGNAIIENVNPSIGYSESSGGGNIRFNPQPNISLIIDYINTLYFEDIVLGMGIINNGNGAIQKHIKVETSEDGISWKNLPIKSTNESLCSWEWAESNGTFPIGSRIRVRIRTQSQNPIGFRIDDIKLSGFYSAPLPVNVTSFSALAKDECNEIRWATLSESNIRYYILNRSYDGINWNIIEEITSRWSESNSNVYQIEDCDIREGITYYQLLINEELVIIKHPRMVAVMRDEEDDDYEYYDLFGNSIKRPISGHLYIRKKNNQIDKIIIN
jgi:hypothetical protein